MQCLRGFQPLRLLRTISQIIILFYDASLYNVIALWMLFILNIEKIPSLVYQIPLEIVQCTNAQGVSLGLHGTFRHFGKFAGHCLSVEQ